MIQCSEAQILKALVGQIKLDFRSNEPIYLQIVRQVERLVASGELHQGDQLPTVRQLATELRVNFNTVARAYRLLDEARLISTQRGRGTYIWEEPTQETINHLHQRGLVDSAKRYLSEAVRLGFSPQEAVTALEELARTDPGDNTLLDENLLDDEM
jgi:GntR family transcriptional regulator